jgi:hypothetical protein
MLRTAFLLVCLTTQDFLAALPLRCYTDPRLGGSALNLASALQERDNPTDLGPKCYIAYGRVAETQGEGDSVTKCHNDMTGVACPTYDALLAGCIHCVDSTSATCFSLVCA